MFPIWIVPILDKKEKTIKKEAGNVDIEILSFVDDMCMDIIDLEGGCNMQKVEVNVQRITQEVANECRLALETDEKEILHLRKSRKDKNADPKYVK